MHDTRRFVEAGEGLVNGFWVDSLLQSLENTHKKKQLSIEEQKRFEELHNKLEQAAQMIGAVDLRKELEAGRGLRALSRSIPSVEMDGITRALERVRTNVSSLSTFFDLFIGDLSPQIDCRLDSLILILGSRNAAYQTPLQKHNIIIRTHIA